MLSCCQSQADAGHRHSIVVILSDYQDSSWGDLLMVRELIHSSSNHSSNRSDTSKAKTLSLTFNHKTERSEQLTEADVTFLHGVLNIHFANLKLLEKLKTQLQFIFKVFSFQFISPHLLQFTILSFHSFLCFIQIFALISNKI